MRAETLKDKMMVVFRRMHELNIPVTLEMLAEVTDKSPTTLRGRLSELRRDGMITVRNKKLNGRIVRHGRNKKAVKEYFIVVAESE